jgi:uncharacterized protein YfaS (alpha-2-macroglobulin family)
MLSRVNEALSRLLQFIWDAGLFAWNAVVAPVGLALVGSWQPPRWLAWTGRTLARPLAWLRTHALLSLLVIGAAVGGWQGRQPLHQQWLRWFPPGVVADKTDPVSASFKLVEPTRTEIESGGSPKPLLVRFTHPVVAVGKVGKDAAGIRMTPALAGRWIWNTTEELAFTPKEDWPVGRQVEVELDEKALLPHVELKDDSFTFRTPAFSAELAHAEFYQDPVQVNLRRVIFQLRFSHPVDTAALESHLRLEDGEGGSGGLLGIGADAGRKFTVSYDELKLNATVMSEPLPIPAESRSMRLTIAAGVGAKRGGPATEADIKRSVEVPGLYSLAISEVGADVVTSDAGDPEHVLRVAASMPVHERELARVVSAWLLPVSGKEGGQDPYAWSDPQEVTEAVLKRAARMKLEAIPGEREVDDSSAFRMPQALGGRYLYVRVAKGLKTPGGYQLGNERVEVLQLKAFAPELAIMSRGSLLALSGDKKLPLIVRDLPGVKLEIARLLPQQLHLLVSHSRGDLTSPRFTFGVNPDELSERFERRIPLNLAQGKTSYETVDFGEYLKAGGGERRGVFLLKVQGWDPKKEEAGKAGNDEHRAAADEEGGGYSSEGDEGGGENNGEAADPSQMQDTRMVIVTDLGLVAKRAVDGGREVFVQSIASGAPVAGVLVEAWGRNGLVLASATTDATGRAHLPTLEAFQREKQPVLLAARKDGDLSFLPLGRSERALDVSRFDVGGVYSASLPNQMRAYLFSDRGIYRPGETLHLGVLVKSTDWSNSLRDMPVEAEVIDPRGLVVKRETLRLGASGAAEITHATQEASPTGNYTVNLSLARQGATDAPSLVLGSATVKVQEFLPDRTKVRASLNVESAEGWIRPQDVKLLVDVQNLFGAPAQQRRVEGTLTLSPTWPRFAAYPDHSFYTPGGSTSPQTDELGQGRSDDKGHAEFDLRLERFAAPTFQVHALVKAFEPEGGRSVAAEVRTLVSSAPWLVGVKADGDLGWIPRGGARRVNLIAIDPKAHKIAAAGLKLERIERKVLSVLVKQSNGLYRYESRGKEISLGVQALALPAAGSELALDTSAPGQFSYLLRDAEGAVLNRIDYTVAGNANLSRSLDRNAELQIKLDKADYQSGEDITLSIQAPYTGSGLITIERDKVYAHVWFKADKTASVQRITLPKDFEGNGYVSVQFVRDPSSDEIYTSPLSYGVAPFSTSLARRTTKVELKSDTLVKPGQVVKMVLKTDQPARAFVFAVDEGILQVARYKQPDPLKFFFEKRALEVGTMQTLDLILPEFKKLVRGLAPGGDGEGEMGKHLNPFKRKRDKPVAYWSGLVEVDGSREFSYTVPESFNGSLRVMAVVVNDQTVAATSTQTTVRGDLILLPTVPASLAPGDEIDVGVGVANQIAGSGKEAPIALKLAVTGGLEVVGPAVQNLKINERGEGSTNFRVRARPGATARLGPAAVVFTAEGPRPAGAKAPASARLSTDLSVRPASPLVTLVQSGHVVGNGELKSQTEVYPEFARSELAVSALPWAYASGLMRYLDDYPYGCTEQISSRAVPQLILATHPELAAEAAQARRGDPAASRKAITPRDALARYFTELRQRQTGDGGIAAWPGGSADEFATTQAVLVMVEARERQVPVPQDLLNKANVYLQSRLGSGADDGWAWSQRSMVAWLLTRQGIAVPAALANLRESLRANGARSWQRMDRDIGAAWLAGAYQILKQDKVAAELIDGPWTELRTRVDKDQAKQAFGLYNDPLVYDSRLIYLVARHFPQRLRELPLQSWARLGKHIEQGWVSSLSSSATVLAVDAYAQAAAQSAHASRGKLQVAAVDAQGRSQPLPVGDINQLLKLPVPVGSTRLKLGSGGELPLFYAWSESGYERKLPGKATGNGFEIVHEMLDAKGKVVTEARIGDELTVRIRVRSLERARIDQVVIVDLLPGGLEPLPQPAAGEGEEGSDLPGWRQRLGGSGTWNLDFADMREDRVLFFGSIVDSMQEITYKVRATNVGQFALPAAYGEAMYERRLAARSAAGSFTVRAADAK